MNKVDWETIAGNMPYLLMGLDAGNAVIFFRGAAARIFNMSEEQITGRSLNDFLHMFREHEIIRDDSQKVQRIICKDSRFKNDCIELETVCSMETPEGGSVWVFRDQTEKNLLERFLDSYHDRVENELSEIVGAKTRSFEQLTRALVTALEDANLYNDTETGSHIIRVSEYSALLAEKSGCDPVFVKKIRLYSSLHDVGKVGIADAILKKPGKYTHEEYKDMQQHVVIGARMLNHPEIDAMAANIALYHHEKWDGTGYLHGLTGADIPLEARIVSVADTYDALRTKRVYKKAFPREETLAIILGGKGTYFDPMIVEVLVEHEEQFDEINSTQS